MSKAFKCDECGEFHMGFSASEQNLKLGDYKIAFTIGLPREIDSSPSHEALHKLVGIPVETVRIQEADLCEDCAIKILTSAVTSGQFDKEEEEA